MTKISGLSVLPLLLVGCGLAFAKTPSASQDVAHLLIGLLTDTHSRPDVDALDTFAAANQWQKVPDNIKPMVHAKAVYAGNVDGENVVVGGDGTNHVFTLVMSGHFVPDEILGALRQVYKLVLTADTTEDGKRKQAFQISDGNKKIGFVLLTYGEVPAIQGSGTIGFLSTAPFRKGMADFK